MTVSSCDIQNTGNVIGSDLDTQFGGHLTRKADPESISWRLIKTSGKNTCSLVVGEIIYDEQLNSMVKKWEKGVY